MPGVDLDFQRYIERRRGAHEAEKREGAAYAHAADLRYLRTLEGLRPVRLALDAAGRLWSGSARDALLKEASRVTPGRDPNVGEAMARAAASLHVPPPATFLSSKEGVGTLVLGTNEDPVVVVGRALAAVLTAPELTFVLGRLVGHVQNGHVLYATARHYLDHDAGRFLRWSVAPARAALSAWWRRAQLTGDRAGLVCGRDLDAACAALGKLLPPKEVEPRVKELREWAAGPYYRALVEAAK